MNYEIYVCTYTNSIERRIDYNYTKYGDSPPCLNEDIDLPNQNAQLQGFGLSQSQGETVIGELLQLELRTLKNEECYKVYNKCCI